MDPMLAAAGGAALTTLMAALQSAAPSGKAAPVSGLNFELSLLTFSLANFCEVRGLTSEAETETYREGGVNHCVYTLPKGVKGANLVLKAGLSGSDFLWAWFSTLALTSSVIPLPLQLSLRHPDGSSAKSWLINNAYPVKWDGPDLNAKDGAVAFESIEIAHQGIWQI